MKLIRKIFSKEDNKDLGRDIAKGSAALVGGTLAHKGAGIINNKLFDSPVTVETDEKIFDKLVKKANKQGTKVIKSKNRTLDGNAMYTGGSLAKGFRNLLNKLPREAQREILKKGDLPEMFGKDAVVLGRGMDDVATLAHELGHARYQGNNSKNIIAKIAHRSYAPSALLNVERKNVSVNSGIAAINGFKSGRRAIKSLNKGEKESTWNKVRSVAVPLAISAPVLVSELAASNKGLRLLKKSGASKKLMKQSRKDLSTAFGTYATMHARPVIVGATSREVGKAYEKVKSKSKKDSK